MQIFKNWKKKQANWNIFHTVIQLIKNIIHNLLKERNNLDSLEGMIDLKWKCYDWSIDLLSGASALFKSRHAASPRGPWSSGFRGTHRSIHLQCGYQDTERQDEPASSVLLDICPIGRRSRCLVKHLVTERLFTSLTLASPGILFSDEMWHVCDIQLTKDRWGNDCCFCMLDSDIRVYKWEHAHVPKRT